jgi:hypothetical protein
MRSQLADLVKRGKTCHEVELLAGLLGRLAGLLPDCRLGCLGELRHAGYSRPVGSVMAGMVGVGEVARLDELAKLIDRVGAVLLSALADVYLHRSQAKSRGLPSSVSG